MTNIVKNKKAFSLIELSIVLIIIALLVVGVIGGQRLIALGKTATAKTATKSSPVSSIKGLALWIETTIPESLKEDDAEDGENITAWYDINPQTGDKKTIELQGDPTYKDDLAAETINRIPAIDFDGSGDYLTVSNLTLNTEMTMFVVGKFDDSDFHIDFFAEIDPSTSHGFIFSTGGDTNETPIAIYGYNAAQTTTSSVVGSTVPDDADWFGEIEAIATVRYNGETISYRRNRESWDTTATVHNSHSSAGSHAHSFAYSDIIDKDNTGTLTIGALNGGLSTTNGHLGELIIFDRALTDAQVDLVLEYLVKKWAIKH